MPGQGYGFQPKKITMNRLGGGGPEFGSDFSRGYQQPMQIQTSSRAAQPPPDMIYKVQDSLDNLSLSPRTPDYYGQVEFLSLYIMSFRMQLKSCTKESGCHVCTYFYFSYW